jgi:hypothetical protein
MLCPMRAPTPPVSALVIGLLATTVFGCSTGGSTSPGPDGSDPVDTGRPVEADCTSLPVPLIGCLRGNPIFICELNASGQSAWTPLCPNVEQGGSTGAAGAGPVGGSGGTGGAAGQAGTGGANSGGAAGSSGSTAAVDGGTGQICSSTETCASGEVCTTEDGVCNGCGAGGFCPPVCYGTCRLAAAGTGCNADSDCRLAADYCHGCDCRALGPGAKVPACNGPGVSCFADACLNKTARCVNGACVAQ